VDDGLGFVDAETLARGLAEVDGVALADGEGVGDVGATGATLFADCATFALLASDRLATT